MAGRRAAAEGGCTAGLSLSRLPAGWLIVVCLLLGAVPLGLLTYFSLSLAEDATRHEAEASVRSTATVSAFAVQNEMQGFKQVVASYAQRPRLISAIVHHEPRAIRFQLRELQHAKRGIPSAGLIKPNGDLVDVVPETPSIIGKNFGFRDWYTGVTRTRRPYVSEAIVSQAKGHPRVVTAAALLRDPHGRDLGILAAGYTLDYIQSFVNRLARTEHLELTVTDQRGVILATPGRLPSRLSSHRADPGIAGALQGRTGTFEHHGPHGTLISSFAPVPGLGWTVVTSIPSREALSEVNDLRSTIILIAIFLGLVMLAGLALLARALWQRDRTERELRAARRRLAAQNKELRELDRAKDEFVSLVTHELRTPLTSIVGYLELIREGEAGELTDETARFVKVIDRNANRLLSVVGDLLLIARIDAGRLQLEPSRLELEQVATETVETARPAADDKGILLDLVLDEGPVVEADRERLGQVLDNLVSNALKFTPSGGRVEVRVTRSDGSARVEVVDTGMGIPEREQRHMFERFFRTSSASQQAIQGSGLGLAITKALVEAHHGTITFESVENEGTTFTIELPLADDVGPAAAANGEETRL